MSELLAEAHEREAVDDVELVEVFPVDHPEVSFDTSGLDGVYRIFDDGGPGVIEFVFNSNDFRLMTTIAEVELTLRGGETVTGSPVASKTNGEQTLIAVEPKERI